MEDISIVGLTDEQYVAAKKIRDTIQKAVDSWVNWNNSGGTYRDMSNYYYNKAEKMAQKWGEVEFDRGVGLYPTFQVVYKGREYTEYYVESFFKRINGFWDFQLAQ